MKFRKVIVIVLIILMIVNIDTISFGKYVFTYTQNAIELNIDRTPPKLNIEYSNKEPTAKGIEAKIIANEKIQEVNGWELQEDGKTLIKIYEENINETIIVKDLAGNESIADILVTNIDKEPPIAEIIEIINTNTGYESYANKTHEITVKIKISDENKIIDNLQDFKILVGDIENNCTRKISYLDPKFIVLLKGIFSGGISLTLGFIFQESIVFTWPVFASLGVGVVAYGLSIFFYVYAQRYIGAAKTSTFYAIAPFISTLLSIIIFQ